jgi:peptide/nickel transport system substrate-binding protein
MRRIRTALLGLAAAIHFGGIAAADTLRVGLAVEPSSLDPHFHNIQPNLQIARQVFDFLITRDHRQQLGPGLAVSWQAIDEKTWEFKLRGGVKWHDGSPFTADDVIFTVGRVPNVPGSPGGYGSYALGKRVTKVNDLTIRVTTDKPNPLMLNDLATFAIVSRKHGEIATTESYNTGPAAIGTGPYRLVEWVRGDRIVFEANKEYWGGQTPWDRVVFRPIASNASRIAALLGGQVDLIDNVPLVDIAQLKRNSNVVLSQSPSNRLIFFALDSSRHISPFVKAHDGAALWPNPLRDARVRKAISMAINRPGIVDRIMDGGAIAAGQIVPEGFFGHDPSLKAEKYDPADAKKLLSEAGYPDGFRITIHGPRDRYPNDASIVESAAQMLTQVGIKTEVAILPASVYFTRASRLEYSFAFYAFGSDTGEASSPLNGVLSSFNPQTGAGAFNRGRYSNANFDAVMQEALITMDDVKREQLLREATAIAIGDYAVIPVHFQINTWALRKGLRYEARTDENTLPRSVSKAE